MREPEPVLWADEDGDGLCEVAVMPGNGTEGFIAELGYEPVWSEATREWSYSTLMMCDIPSLEDYDFYTFMHEPVGLDRAVALLEEAAE